MFEKDFDELREIVAKLTAERDRIQKDWERLNIKCGCLSLEVERYRDALEWYANWDWSDKYVQAVPKRAKEALSGDPIKTKSGD